LRDNERPSSLALEPVEPVEPVDKPKRRKIGRRHFAEPLQRSGRGKISSQMAHPFSDN
jgi:hypothetical protein